MLFSVSKIYIIILYVDNKSIRYNYMYCTYAVLKKGGWWDMPCIYVHTVNDFWSHDFTCVYVLYIVSCSHSEEAIASQAVHRTQKVWKTEQVYCQEEKKERQQRPKTVAFQENTLTMSLVYIHMFISTLGSHCDASLWILLYLIKLELSFYFHHNYLVIKTLT